MIFPVPSPLLVSGAIKLDLMGIMVAKLDGSLVAVGFRDHVG